MFTSNNTKCQPFFFPNFLDCRFPSWKTKTPLGLPDREAFLAVEPGEYKALAVTVWPQDLADLAHRRTPGSGGWDTAKRSGKPMPQALKQLENENFLKKHGGKKTPRISHNFTCHTNLKLKSVSFNSVSFPWPDSVPRPSPGDLQIDMKNSPIRNHQRLKVPSGALVNVGISEHFTSCLEVNHLRFRFSERKVWSHVNTWEYFGVWLC